MRRGLRLKRQTFDGVYFILFFDYLGHYCLFMLTTKVRHGPHVLYFQVPQSTY
jgi:hypothetical protein